jgi:hypothetical protein
MKHGVGEMRGMSIELWVSKTGLCIRRSRIEVTVRREIHEIKEQKSKLPVQREHHL